MEIKHTEDGQKGEFFMELEGKRIGEMSYRIDKENRMLIDHTEVFEKEQGKGLAKELVRRGVEYAREKHQKIIPYCSYAKRVIDMTAEYHDVLDKPQAG